MCDKVACERVVWETVVCVCMRVCVHVRVRDAEGQRRTDNWIQNQKNEPHTKMWGRINIRTATDLKHLRPTGWRAFRALRARSIGEATST